MAQIDPTLTPAAIRARRYRQRKRNGVFVVRVRFSEHDIAALIEGGFLPASKREGADIEAAFYCLLNAARRAGVTARDA